MSSRGRGRISRSVDLESRPGQPTALASADRDLPWPLQLQQSLGNRAVRRLFQASPQKSRNSPSAPVRNANTSELTEQNGTPQTRVSTTRTINFSVSIPRGPATQAAAAPATPASRSDAGPGQEAPTEELLASLTPGVTDSQPASVPSETQATGNAPPSGAQPAPQPPSEQAVPQQAAPAAEPQGQAEAGAPAEKKPIRMPNIEVPALAQVERSDAVAAFLGYNGSIARGGADPSGFGVTRSFGSNLSDISILPLFGNFLVTGKLNHPITYQVRSGTGPDGQVDISSMSDGDISDANYADVAADLMPDWSDLNGRPPRNNYWAEDLTLKHERVHADDDHANGPGALQTVVSWLQGQSAASVADVNALLATVPNRFATALLAALSTEDGERHAYGDGAPSYLARSLGISARGATIGY